MVVLLRRSRGAIGGWVEVSEMKCYSTDEQTHILPYHVGVYGATLSSEGGGSLTVKDEADQSMWRHSIATGAGWKRQNACESNISCYFSLTNAVLTFLLPRPWGKTTIERRTKFHGGWNGFRVVMGGGNLMVESPSEIDGLVFFLFCSLCYAVRGLLHLSFWTLAFIIQINDLLWKF